MSLEYRTKGFIFKKADRNESDRIFTVFTYDFGKLDIFAKAIRKINSKLRSGIDIFCFSEIEFVQGKKKTLIDAILINNFFEIKNSPKKFLIANKIAKILDNFIKGEEHDHEIFNLIFQTFEKLNKLQVTSYKLQALYLYFLWNFLAILGYGPELSKCVDCRGNLDEKELYFSFKDGGLICKNCVKTKKDNITRITSDVVKILRIILKNDWSTILKLKINSESQKELNAISKNYYLYLLSSHSSKQKI
jgi:DNA repair protein RecO (recombination protein O)